MPDGGPETNAGWDRERLAADLRVLGRSAALPPVNRDRLAARVSRALPPAQEPRTRPRRLALVALAVLAALLATPAVRAAVADWFGFAGVRVERGDTGGPASPPPVLRGGPGVQRAAAEVSFAVLAPKVLGGPAGVEVSPDRRVVSMTWRGEGGVVRLDQFDGGLDFSIAKRSPQVGFAAVDGVDALWFEEPHEVVLIDADGTRRTESARLAGHTLIWPRGSTTLRLEGDLSLDEAVRIAESAVPVG